MTTPSYGQLIFGEPDDDQPALPSRCPRCRAASDCWIYFGGSKYLCGRCYYELRRDEEPDNFTPAPLTLPARHRLASKKGEPVFFLRPGGCSEEDFATIIDVLLAQARARQREHDANRGRREDRNG
jgi:hypothetical protein